MKFRIDLGINANVYVDKLKDFNIKCDNLDDGFLIEINDLDSLLKVSETLNRPLLINNKENSGEYPDLLIYDERFTRNDRC